MKQIPVGSLLDLRQLSKWSVLRVTIVWAGPHLVLPVQQDPIAVAEGILSLHRALRARPLLCSGQGRLARSVRQARSLESVAPLRAALAEFRPNKLSGLSKPRKIQARLVTSWCLQFESVHQGKRCDIVVPPVWE
ncbi:hypothetical protein PHLCEN_2v3377 [Hermanssonia centrifuga]|uniref:Uncharacterized protein n=1 Tax=Hermanssonia centrifuga TaxID=98765 RepID=A0A2R6QIW0_9APHY|nr:hypothetical protein PHLCEN_2v3377 [Hermanssonia centrifuga]